MRTQNVYTKVITIRPEDLDYIRKLRDERINRKKSLAGVLAHIINYYKNYENTQRQDGKAKSKGLV